jgi:hypothetical protein
MIFAFVLLAGGLAGQITKPAMTARSCARRRDAR